MYVLCCVVCWLLVVVGCGVCFVDCRLLFVGCWLLRAARYLLVRWFVCRLSVGFLYRFVKI